MNKVNPSGAKIGDCCPYVEIGKPQHDANKKKMEFGKKKYLKMKYHHVVHSFVIKGRMML